MSQVLPFRSKKKRIPRTLYFFLNLCVYVLLLAVPVAQAATAYLTPEIRYRPTWGDEYVDIYFTPNEELCREAYGKKWEDECTVWLGEKHSTPKGLVAHDWPKGRWTWTRTNRLRFYPEESWKSGTDYVANISKLEIPSRVQLSTKQVHFRSIPRCASIDNGKVWIDPSAKGDHAISFSMRFTESLSDSTRRAIMQQATFSTEKQLNLSKPTWVWLEDNSRAVVTTRILQLPPKRSTLELTLPQVRPIWEDEKKWYFPDRNATKGLVVPGVDSTFTLEEVQFESVENKALQMEHHIIFRFSQRVSAEEFLKAATFLELPLKRSQENIIPTDWSEGGVDPDAKNKARKLKAEWVPQTDEKEDYLRFRVDAAPGKYVFWNINAGFGPTTDQGVHNPLERNLEGVSYVPSGEARLEFLQAGNVLLQDSDLAIMSENLDSIRWSAHRFADNSWALPFLSRLDDTFDSDQLYANTTALRGEISLAPAQKSEASYASKPLFNTLQAEKVFGTAEDGVAPGLVYLKLEGIKDGRVVTSTGRMLMFSNMALVLKEQADRTTQVYVGSLQNAKALEGILIQVLGRNGHTVAEARTQADGKALLPDLSHLTRENEPVAVVARQKIWNDEDILWMSLTDYKRNVNLSRFSDIEGKQSSINALNAFVFSERGLFRPGETMNFGVLLRANDWKLLPPNMPLKATLRDPSWRKVWQKPFTAGESIHSLSWDIPESAMTGHYELLISTPTDSLNTDDSGLVLGTARVLVSSFIPDTLKLSTSLVDTGDGTTQDVSTKGWLVTSDKVGSTALSVRLRTLFGQAAVDRRVTAYMELRPAYLSFAGYEDYTFQDTSPFFTQSQDPIERELEESTTNAKGEALLPLDFTQWRFGTLQCNITTEGYEPGGGRSVSQSKRFLLSPLPYMLGYKTGQGADNIDFIIKNSVAQLQFQAVDSQLKPFNPGSLVFSVTRQNTVNSLVTDERGLYSYDTTIVETKFSEKQHSLSAEGVLKWDMPTQEVGDYLLTVQLSEQASKDAGLKAGTVLARVHYSIVGNDDLRPALKQAEYLPKAKLRLKSDKRNYTGGDVAQLMVTTPYEGVALISLERDSVVAHKWVQLPVGNSMQELPIPQDFTGRGYIQVLMGRAPQSENIFIQPQSVAMIPVNVNTKQRQVDISITAPEKGLPGKTLQWNIKNNQGKATKALLFAVDEGILQLSKFRTPDPLHYLLLDRALEVNTKQLFDRVMPEHAQIMKRLSAFGGDGDGADLFAGLLGTFQNPFKRTLEPPVVWWSGVVDIPAEGLNVEVPIPDYYNGNIRLMAILQNDQAVGSAEENVIVRGEQVLAPQLPAMAALGDAFEASISITNTTKNAMTLALSSGFAEKSTTRDLKISALPESITLAPMEEKLIPFQVEVGQTPGNALLRFSVQTESGTVVERSTAISIRPAVFPNYSQQSFMLSQSTTIHSQRELLPYDAQTSITLSPTPLPLLRTSLNYLKNYPFDCVEQTISKAFPLAVLTNSPLAPTLEKTHILASSQEREKARKEAHNALVAAFNPYYGVNLWTDEAYNADKFLTAYAANYLLALQEAKLPVPMDFMASLFNTLEEITSNSPETLEELRTTAYAAWVLARAGYVVSKPLELCEAYIKEAKHERSDIFNSFMAGAYAALYMMPEAQQHLDKVTGKAPQTWRSASGMFDTLAQYGLHTQVLAKHFPEALQEAIPYMEKLFLEGLNKPHATMGAAMSAVALAEIMKVKGLTDAQMNNASIACGAYDAGIPTPEQAMVQAFPGLALLEAPNCARFDVKIPQNSLYFAEVQSYGYDKNLPTKDLVQGLSVYKEISNTTGKSDYEQEDTIIVTQGDVLAVYVSVKLTDDSLAQVAVVDLLPGGFELVMEHEDDTTTSDDIRLDRREDRVIAFIDAYNSETGFTYHIRAINKGSYTLPATYAEGLFDRSLQGNTVTNRIIVKAPQ